MKKNEENDNERPYKKIGRNDKKRPCKKLDEMTTNDLEKIWT